jgi:hypothetical protein
MAADLTLRDTSRRTPVSRFGAVASIALTVSLALYGVGPWSHLNAFATSPATIHSVATGCDDPVASTASDTWIYVSADTGDDSNSGLDSSHPVRSLTRAQDVVRSINSAMTGNIVVCIQPGMYRLAQPLLFGPQDSGSNGFDVVWTSSATDPATVAGSYQATNWSEFDKNLNIWVASVPGNVLTRQIYVDGVRATLASGAVRGTVISRSTGYEMYPNPLATWPDASSVDFGYLGSLGLWTNAICPVASAKGYTITMAEPCWKNSTQRTYNYVGWGNLTKPTYMENAYELLRKPGQFYLSATTHKLYYIPRPGQNLNSADVEVPFLESLVSGAGTSNSPVQNITFSNLEFAYATWLRPSTPEGFSEIQSNYTLTGPDAGHKEGLCLYARHGACPYGAWTQTPGNVGFTYDRNINFANDRFVHLGAAALDLNDGSQDDSVTGSVFTDISGNGIELGNVDLPQARGVAQTRGVTLADNYLYGFPVEYQGGCPIIVGYAADTLITHNTIEDVPYSGISIGWGGWPDKYGHPALANFSANNTISYNIVANFMQLLSDGGGIYTQGITGHSWATGEHVDDNVVHDELDWSRALQSDDGASWDTYADNVLYNNDYDWGTNHINYTKRDGTYDPTSLENNFWQQGDPNTNHRMFIEHNNTVISDPSQAPSSIVDAAGLEPSYSALLDWLPSSAPAPPSSPERLKSLYAFEHSVYLTWRPGFADGTDPVTSFTVHTCLIAPDSYDGACGKSVGQPVTVPASEFYQLGYVVIQGLSDGSNYSFTVTENSEAGNSTPSIPSDPIKVVKGTPQLPGHPNHLVVRRGMGAISLQWYAPGSARAHYYHFASQPILAYVVTPRIGSTLLPSRTVTGLAQTITSNGGSKTIYMVTGLTPGQQYTFDVAAVTPAGSGKVAHSAPITPLPYPSG